MIKLFVNVDHVATVREARKTYEPDPLEAAIIAEKAGASGITAHLREDRRHVQDDDIRRLKNQITTPLNLEMAAVDEMITIAIERLVDGTTAAALVRVDGDVAKGRGVFAVSEEGRTGAPGVGEERNHPLGAGELYAYGMLDPGG